MCGIVGVIGSEPAATVLPDRKPRPPRALWAKCPPMIEKGENSSMNTPAITKAAARKLPGPPDRLGNHVRDASGRGRR